MSSTASFASTASPDLAQISAANTNRDGTGTLVTVSTGTTSGDRIEDIELCAAGTTTDGVVRLFIFDGTNTDSSRRFLYRPSRRARRIRCGLTNSSISGGCSN